MAQTQEVLFGSSCPMNRRGGRPLPLTSAYETPMPIRRRLDMGPFWSIERPQATSWHFVSPVQEPAACCALAGLPEWRNVPPGRRPGSQGSPGLCPGLICSAPSGQKKGQDARVAQVRERVWRGHRRSRWVGYNAIGGIAFTDLQVSLGNRGHLRAERIPVWISAPRVSSPPTD